MKSLFARKTTLFAILTALATMGCIACNDSENNGRSDDCAGLPFPENSTYCTCNQGKWDCTYAQNDQPCTGDNCKKPDDPTCTGDNCKKQDDPTCTGDNCKKPDDPTSQKVCTANQRQCSKDGVPQECVNNQWKNLNACAKGLSCEKGDCIVKCKTDEVAYGHACIPQKMIDTYNRYYDVYNSPCAPEWSDLQFCIDGDLVYCSGGLLKVVGLYGCDCAEYDLSDFIKTGSPYRHGCRDYTKDIDCKNESQIVYKCKDGLDDNSSGYREHSGWQDVYICALDSSNKISAYQVDSEEDAKLMNLTIGNCESNHCDEKREFCATTECWDDIHCLDGVCSKNNTCVECNEDYDCWYVEANNGSVCMDNNTCGCFDSSDCDYPLTPVCDTTVNTCKECLNNDDCADNVEDHGFICKDNKCGCNTKADCRDGFFCINGVCDIGCTNNSNCTNDTNGHICMNKKCGCNSKSDCFDGYYCENSVCIKGCSNNNECADNNNGHICVDEKCGCNNKSDCPNGYLCEDSVCVYDRCSQSDSKGFMYCEGEKVIACQNGAKVSAKSHLCTTSNSLGAKCVEFSVNDIYDNTEQYANCGCYVDTDCKRGYKCNTAKHYCELDPAANTCDGYNTECRQNMMVHCTGGKIKDSTPCAYYGWDKYTYFGSVCTNGDSLCGCTTDADCLGLNDKCRDGLCSHLSASID